jgi:hypothetical protein
MSSCSAQVRELLFADRGVPRLVQDSPLRRGDLIATNDHRMGETPGNGLRLLDA